jgi:signal transduction histidine kinase
MRRRGAAAPAPLALGLAAATAGIAVLSLIYQNWHSWNQGPAFLRNVPLVLMARSPLARVLGSALLVAGLLAVVALWQTLPGRKHLYLLAFCTALFLLPHALVEVRYAIMPFFMADFVAGYEPRQQARLAGWYLILSATVAALLLSGTFVLW